MNCNTEYDERQIKCKNYEICEGTLTGCRNMCIACLMMFGTRSNSTHESYRTGKLDILDDLVCSACLETRRSVLLPTCSHTLCIRCFRNYYYNEDIDDENEPIFPYPDIEEEYSNNPEDPKWEKYYPLIKIFNERWNIRGENQIDDYLHRRPVCKK